MDHKSPKDTLQDVNCTFNDLICHYIPQGIIATAVKKPGLGHPWPDPSERCLTHDHWLVCTTDQTKKKDRVRFIISFDSIVDIECIRLSDPERWRDQLTKKLLILRLMDYGIKGKRQGAATLFTTSMYLDWLVRWRLSIGIDMNSMLQNSHFEDYVSLISKGVSGLVPISQRFHDLVDRGDGGDKPSFIVSRGDRLTIDWDWLAQQLGVTPISLRQSPEFISEIADNLERLAPDAKASLLIDIRNDMNHASKASVGDILAPWRVLSQLSRLDLLSHDPLGFDPFADAASAALVRRREPYSSRTGNILPDDLLRLMSAAAVWVLDFGHHVIAAWEATLDLSARDVRKPSKRDSVARALLATAPNALPPIRLVHMLRSDHERNEGKISAYEAVKHLLTACAILVGSFGARRVGEITSLRRGCLVEDRKGILGLTIYIEKSLRDIDIVPVPSMMKNVVSMLELMTERTRSTTGKDWLFEIRTNDGVKPFMGFDLSRSLNDFAQINNLPPPSGEDRWDLKAHQLRRGFAIAYYHGFKASSFDALSRFLRHVDPEMTRIYINQVTSGAMARLREEIDARAKVAFSSLSENDKIWIGDAKRLLQDISDRGDAFEEVRCEALVHRMLSMWDGTEQPVGLGVPRLKNDLSAMVREAETFIRLGSRSNNPDAVRVPLLNSLRSYAKTHYLDPVPGSAAHCAARPNNTEDLSHAECQKVKEVSPERDCPPTDLTRPDSSYASTYVCLRCPLCVVFQDGQKTIGELEGRFSLALQQAATPSAATSAAAKLAAFKVAIKAARDVTASVA